MIHDLFNLFILWVILLINTKTTSYDGNERNMVALPKVL